MIESNILISLLCFLQYLKHNKKTLQYNTQFCKSCSRYQFDPELGTSTQMRFVD